MIVFNINFAIYFQMASNPDFLRQMMDNPMVQVWNLQVSWTSSYRNKIEKKTIYDNK